VLTRLPRFGKFIPSIIGLLSIPLIIHPIDHATDFVMDNTIRGRLYPYPISSDSDGNDGSGDSVK
jgi:hypothetical protein